MGLNKRLFHIWKFRTMVQDAEAKLQSLEKHNEVEGPVFKIKNDPRITSIGKFLRKTSIDELPQLLNVLLGDMSLVGPTTPAGARLRRIRSGLAETAIQRDAGNHVPLAGKWEKSSGLR